MTRFAWLQSRTQTLVVAGLLVALAAVAAVTGVQLSHLFHSSVAHCTSGCDFAVNHFLSRYRYLDNTFDILARAVPALLGMFWGAPLVARELETGSYRLAWTQSVSRSRWLVTRLAIAGLATVALAGLLTLTITWWYTSRAQTGDSEPFALFDRRDVAPVAYAAFAFAVGALLGAVLRRTLPAMAATLGVFVFTRVAIGAWVRPHLMTPVHQTLSLLGAGPDQRVQLGIGFSKGGPLQLFIKGGGPPRSWTVSSYPVTSSGHRVTSEQLSAFMHHYCPNVGPPPAPPPGGGIAKVVGQDSGRACLAQVAKSFHVVVSYQPDSRYWAFQWMEAGIFVALTAAALVGCYFWVTRRVS
jgi:ABC-type transport system involved in multi-copper enzyme maturation permease subunit